MVYVPPGPAAFAALGQRSAQQVPEASRGEAGRAAADVYSKAKDGGTLSRYLPLSKSHRRRVRSARVGRAPVYRRSAVALGFLGGRRIRTVPPTGAKVRQRRTPKRAFGYFSRVGKVPRPGGRNPPSPLPRGGTASITFSSAFEYPPQKTSTPDTPPPAGSEWRRHTAAPPPPGSNWC